MHYERWRLTGTTDSQRPPLEERFWAKVDMSSGPDGCWPWTAALQTTGYGAFGVTSRQIVAAHRMAYELTTGETLGAKHIDHICFRRDCVNPRHLRAVTQQQNNEHRQGAQRNSKSGVRGVVELSPGKWRAQAEKDGKNHVVGTFATLDEAAEAARYKRCELFTHNDADHEAAPEFSKFTN
jgi:hypothetical protein